jgi:hypothetical protein
MELPAFGDVGRRWVITGVDCTNDRCRSKTA